MSAQQVTVWDPLVRLFHWSTVALFLSNYWLLEGGEDPHQWAGYAIALLLAVRIAWGFVGSANARFANFWPTRARLYRHWRALKQRLKPESTEGHNPFGALMILLLMSLLAITAVSGWMQGLNRFWGEDWVENLHEYAANSLMAAAGIHVAAVLIMPRITGLPLIRPMLTGKRSIPD